MFANACIHAEDDLINASFDLMGFLAAKMKIVLSLTLGSGDNIKEFMKRVDELEDVSLMSSLPSSLSTLAQVLKLTKAIMDQVLQVVTCSSPLLLQIHPYLSYSCFFLFLFFFFVKNL